MFFKLALKHEIGHFGELSDKNVSQSLLPTNSELFGNCKQMSVAFFKVVEWGWLQELIEGISHIFDKHFLEFYYSKFYLWRLYLLGLQLHGYYLIWRL